MTKVIFSENAKSYDGSSNDMYKQYCIIASFFGIKEIPINKISITKDELNIIIDDYKKLSKNKPCFSSYLRGQIRTKRREQNMKVKTIKIHPIENSTDCLEFTENNLEFISNILENLRNAKKNINKKKETEKCECEEVENDDDDEWNKRCKSDLCTERKCCLDKKSKILSKSKVSLLRNGSRDYTFTVDIKYEKQVDRLISILEESKETVEKKIHDDDWIKDVGLLS